MADGRRLQSLDGHPAADMIGECAEMWCESLYCKERDQDQEIIRLKTAFNTVFKSAQKWPTPAWLKLHMPALTSKSTCADQLKDKAQIKSHIEKLKEAQRG